ncbi:MAG: transposase [Planctomycetes bacterium]|jgi:REP element-mobilizing transposase RayT|nr:transposase [Planctomycetota bacterium]
MARPLRVEYEGAVYHVAVRGNARQVIFRDDADRAYFVRVLAESVGSFEVRLYLYCLMSNHVHLVLETPRANLGRFMHRLQTAYTVHFNRRHRRVGHLVQGRYGAWLVEREACLLRLSRYVHLNPVFVQAVRSRPLAERVSLLRQYPWSSYRSYIRPRGRLTFVDHGPLLALVEPGRVGQAGAYRRFVEAGIADIDAAFLETKTASRLCLGSPEFREQVRTWYENLLHGQARPEDAAFRRAGRRVSAEKILAIVCRELEVPREELLTRRRDCLPRAVAARMLCDWGALTQRQTADVLGLGSGAAVSLQLRRLADELPSKAQLRKRVDRIRAALADPEARQA